MPYIIKNGLTYTGNSVTLTQAQYDALSEAEKNNGTAYYIYDSDAVLDASDVGLGEGNVEDLAGSVAVIETSPATAIHAVGDFILWNGQLYTVTSAIAVGETLTVGSNITATSAGSELTSLKSGLLWKAIATGVSSSVRVDHSPYSWEELLVVARINQTSYSILIPRNEYRAGQTLWSSGVYFREGVWVGVQFAFLGSTVYLAYANNSGIDVLSSTTYSVYWR